MYYTCDSGYIPILCFSMVLWECLDSEYHPTGNNCFITLKETWSLWTDDKCSGCLGKLLAIWFMIHTVGRGSMGELAKKWVSSARFIVPKTWDSLKVPIFIKGPYCILDLTFYAVLWLIAIACHGVWGGLPFGLYQSDGSASESCTHEELFIVAVPSGLYRK